MTLDWDTIHLWYCHNTDEERNLYPGIECMVNCPCRCHRKLAESVKVVDELL